MRITNLLVIVGLGLFVTACSQSFKSDVARFHKLPAPTGESFLIVAKDEDKNGGIEFSQYAGLVRARLMDIGYRTVTEGDPDLVVRMDYNMSDGDQRTRSRPGYGYGYYGYGLGHSLHSFHHPYWPGYGYYSSGNYSVTVYTRKLEMDILRADGEVLFEGKAISVGRDNRMPEIMPYLVQAMFANFPGESGVTKVVEIETPGGTKY